MRVMAKVLTATGAPAAGRKAAWWVPTKTGSFELWDEGVVGKDGLLDMDVSRASFGSHLRLDGGLVAASPVRFTGSVYDLGVLVLLEPARKEVRAVSAEAYVPSSEPVPPPDSPSPGGVDLEARLKSTGVQIEAARTKLSTVSLTQVRVKWTEATATGALEAEAQFVEPPTKAPVETPPTSVPARPAPDLRGLTPAAAQRAAAAVGLRVEITPLFVAEPERHGRVQRQVPEPGAEVTTPTVRLYVGRNSEN
ncbi:PASTA domain-containing protein [Archangium lansingense]|uniref:PASTA domain-containing protein n=1 Tax=Archangium lansingense TaxID=2995310 RepID=UPI003B79AB09